MRYVALLRAINVGGHTVKMEQLRALWHGYRIAVLVIPDAPPPGVDTAADLARARAALAADAN